MKLSRCLRAIFTVAVLTAAPSLAIAAGTGTAANTDANVVGSYLVVGRVLAAMNISGMHAGDLLDREWRVTRSCAASGCHLVLTRDLAAESAVPPISAVLIPVKGGWKAHFVERSGCPGPGSSLISTEYSTWQIKPFAGGLRALEVGESPAVSNGQMLCRATRDTIAWIAKKVVPPTA